MSTPQLRTLFRSSSLELGLFHHRPRTPETRRSVARTHLMAFTRSCVRIRRDSSEPVVATPHIAVLYNAGCEYACDILSDGLESTVYLRIGDDLLRLALSEIDPASAERADRPLNVACARLAAGLSFQSVLIAKAAEQKGDPLAIEEGLLRLIDGTLRAGFDGGVDDAHSPARQREYARWTQEHLGKTLREGQSIPQIAARVGVSPFHLCRAFRRVTGMSIHAYRSTLRVRMALMELAETGCEVSALARRYGFAHHAHFSNAFRRHFGFAPTVARERLKMAAARVGAA